MRNLLDNLEEAGMDFSEVVSTTIYLDNISDSSAYNEVYGQYFGPVMPASTTVQQIAPMDRKADENGEYPEVEQSFTDRRTQEHALKIRPSSKNAS